MDIGDLASQGYVWDAATAFTTAIDIWEIALTAGYAYRVGGISLTQTTEIGDAQHEVLPFQFVYGNTTSGSGGGTPVSFVNGTGNGLGGVSAVECRNTTAASGGSPSKAQAHGWNVLSPLDVWFPNGLEPQLGPTTGSGEVNVVRFLNAPADSVTMLSTIYIRSGNVSG